MNHIKSTLNKINKIESNLGSLSDDELKEKTMLFKNRIKKGETLDSILPEAFATVSEAAYRVCGMRPYDVQKIGGIALHNGEIAEMKTGEGKALTVDTKIPTPDGWRSAGDIKVGDKLFARDGSVTTVIGVYPQDSPLITYQITLKDGRKILCAGNHRWLVYDKKYGNKEKVLTTEEMFSHGTRYMRNYYRYKLPTPGAAQYPDREYSISPYVMGALIAKYAKNSQNNIGISMKDNWVVEKIAKLLKATDIENSKRSNAVFFKLNDDYLKAHEMYSNPECFIASNRTEQYIPEEYKLGSIEQRWSLIQGLMDCSGTIEEYSQSNPSCRLRYRTVSEQLRDDIMEVIYSLGCSCSWMPGKSATLRNKEYVITINVPNETKEKFFQSPLKKDKLKNINAAREYHPWITITDIQKTEVLNDMVCFTVDNPEHLFLCEMYVPTHNTLVSTMPIYLNALEGKGAHVITVNDYLAKRDAAQMGRIHKFLGLTVGVITSDMNTQARKEAYACDITYITNNELGFDYLRDNMAIRKEDQVQRGLHYAVIDEVDSVLIDEARTPLIISSASGKATDMYRIADFAARTLNKGTADKELSKIDAIAGVRVNETGDFIVNEKDKYVKLTEAGIKKIENFFHIENLASPENIDVQHHIILALKAHYLMLRDKDYVVTPNGEILIVDEFTGRTMEGRRYSDGLHQAIEAKEQVEIKHESKTMATITFQNLFNKYEKKSGMTGTGATERKEFHDIYKMNVRLIPTNKPVIRKDLPDIVFKTKKEKYQAVVKDTLKAHKKGQPVLVGTATIEVSETLSKMFKKHNIPHYVLNAKCNEKEAAIIAEAGKHGAVTIATNMAGRGTDIKLDEKAKKAGGLKVIGTERHESRRIDNQLRGRSGRQGDPGESRFYLSLEDDLLRLFGSEKLIEIFADAGFKDGEPIQHKTLSKFVTNAQKRIEGNHFDTRKNLLGYDDVLNEQREIVYAEKAHILKGENMRNTIMNMIDDYINRASKGKLTGNEEIFLTFKGIRYSKSMRNMSHKKLTKLLKKMAKQLYSEIESKFQDDQMREIERIILLTIIDAKWEAQIENMELLKQGINLQSYGQKDPIVEYRSQGYDFFGIMIREIERDTISSLYHMNVQYAEM